MVCWLQFLPNEAEMPISCRKSFEALGLRTCTRPRSVRPIRSSHKAAILDLIVGQHLDCMAY